MHSCSFGLLRKLSICVAFNFYTHTVTKLNRKWFLNSSNNAPKQKSFLIIDTQHSRGRKSFHAKLKLILMIHHCRIIYTYIYVYQVSRLNVWIASVVDILFSFVLFCFHRLQIIRKWRNSCAKSNNSILKSCDNSQRLELCINLSHTRTHRYTPITFTEWIRSTEETRKKQYQRLGYILSIACLRAIKINPKNKREL